mmetsp:Transcript_7278/g.30132  ORF Transcript_7278/g.30132 Transcript_7278/m.30132 type:complete len:294 (-) Transcript_7278:9-890(-)
MRVQVPYGHLEVVHLRVVVDVALLNRVVGEVNVLILEVALGGAVRGVGEPREPLAVQVHLERLIAEAEHVYPRVELAIVHEVRVVDVALAHVVVGELVLRYLGPALLEPVLDLLRLVHEEDAGALRPADGLHDPRPSLFPEIPEQHLPLPRERVRLGDKIKLARVRPVLLRLPLGALDVLGEQVLAGELDVVREVVHALILPQPLRLGRDVVRDVVVYPGGVSPHDVPRVVVNLPPSPRGEHPVRGALLHGARELDAPRLALAAVRVGAPVAGTRARSGRQRHGAPSREVPTA